MTLGLGTGSVQSPDFFHASLSELGPEGRSREFPSRIRERAYSSVQMHKRYVDLQAAHVARGSTLLQTRKLIHELIHKIGGRLGTS